MNMASLEALKELTAQLSSAGSAEDIGAALLALAKRFGYASALIVDMTKLFNHIGPAIVFSATGRAPIEVFDAKHPFADHPFVMQAQSSDEPFVMAHVQHKRGVGDEDWWERLPAHLKYMNGIVVPVHDNGSLAWYAGFAGREPDLSHRARSVISAAVHAGYARFKTLLDDKTRRSPLTARESECLRWIASGKTDNEVGRILEISPRTVRFHIGNAKTKLGVATRIQAVTKRLAGA
jgi:DNA-binding CsgD family transcriptional regulator